METLSIATKMNLNKSKIFNLMQKNTANFKTRKSKSSMTKESQHKRMVNMLADIVARTTRLTSLVAHQDRILLTYAVYGVDHLS